MGPMRIAILLALLGWVLPAPAAWLCDTEHGEQILLREAPEGFYCEPVGERRAEPQTEAEQAEANCRRSLRCWLRRHDLAAGRHCSVAIQGLAPHGYNWIDDLIFSRFEVRTWHHQDAGTLRFAGDRIEFGNGDGSFTRHAYVCLYDPARGDVIDVRADPGRITR